MAPISPVRVARITLPQEAHAPVAAPPPPVVVPLERTSGESTIYDDLPTRPGGLQISTGPVNFPYHAYAVDGLALFGEADLPTLRKMMEGSGYEPINMGGRGIVTLWVMSYSKTTAGSYDELGVTIAAAPKGQSRVIDNKNACSTLDPVVGQNISFALKLIVTTQMALEVGRKGMGVDKTIGGVDIRRADSAKTYEVRDGDGRLVIAGHQHIDKGLFSSLTVSSALCMARAFGLKDTFALASKTKFQGELVAFDVRRPDRVVSNPDLSTAESPTITQFDARKDWLEIGDQSEIGTLLRRMGFVPRVAFDSKKMGMAFGHPTVTATGAVTGGGHM